MKRIILVLLLLTMFIPNAYAITQEQLEQAKVTIIEMEKSLRSMKIAVNIALRGNVLNLDLTAEQIDALVQRYIANKSELQTLYQELP